MSVVIDEMVGSVEAEPAPRAEEHKDLPAPQEKRLDQLRHELSRLAQREARLRAD